MISVLAYVLLLFTVLIFSGLNLAYADTSNPLTDKEEFDVVVSGISHKSILVSVSIDGHTQNYKIKGNPNYVSAPRCRKLHSNSLETYMLLLQPHPQSNLEIYGFHA